MANRKCEFIVQIPQTMNPQYPHLIVICDNLMESEEKISKIEGVGKITVCDSPWFNPKLLSVDIDLRYDIKEVKQEIEECLSLKDDDYLNKLGLCMDGE